MLKSDLVQTDKHSTNICSGGKISDFSVAQIIKRNRCVQFAQKYEINNLFCNFIQY